MGYKMLRESRVKHEHGINASKTEMANLHMINNLFKESNE